MDDILPGHKIKGLWSGSTYTVIRPLGRGGVGAAYLVSGSGGLRCLKISGDMMSITWEYRFIKDNRKKFLPEAYEIDDFVLNNDIKHYIILEYIEGENLTEAIRARPADVSTAAGIALLTAEIFMEFFETGYIYTDLKPENIMLDVKRGGLRLIDMGSLVKTGGMVREYTPMYDRAYWDCGLRRADEGYASFEIMMLAVNLLFPIDYDMMRRQDITAVLKGLSGCRAPALCSLAARGLSGRAGLCEIRDGLLGICGSRDRAGRDKTDLCINVSLAAGIIFLTGVIIYVF